MKQNLFLFLFTTVLMTTSLAAQRLGRAGPGKMGGPQRLATVDEDAISVQDRCRAMIPPRRVLVRVLELDEDQLAQVAKLHASIPEAVRPLREELKSLAAPFREELGSEDPDACEVGRILLAQKVLRAEICAVTQSFADDFAAILDPDQLEKWETIKDLDFNPRDCCRRPGRDRPE